MRDDVFAVIADPTRRRILQSLALERLAVGELVEELEVSQPTVSKHLKVLRTAGLVETEAVGQKRFYSLKLEPLEQISGWVDSLQNPSLPSTPPPAGAVPAQPDSPAPEAPANEAVPVQPESSNRAEATDHAEDSAGREEAAGEQEAAEQGQASVSVGGAGAEAGQPVPGPITFTPLAPFTPGPLPARVEEEKPVVEGEGQQLAQVQPQELPAETSEQPEGTRSEEAQQPEEAQQLPADSEQESEETPSAQKLTDYYDPDGGLPTAVPQEASTSHSSREGERGIMAKLTRWSRRIPK